MFESEMSDKARVEDHDYDEGGNQLALQLMRPFPADDAGPALTGEPPATVCAHLLSHGYRGGPLTFAQAHWVANLPPAMLGPAAEPLYRWLNSSGQAGLIQIDNKMSVLGGSPTAA